MRRILAFGLVLLTAVVLQTTVFAELTLFHVAPDLILLAVISLALINGPAAGAAAGFFGGVTRDLLLVSPKGITALAYVAVGYAVGSARPHIQATSVVVPVAAVFGGSLAGTLLYVLIGALLGRAPHPLERVAETALLTAAYNTLLAPLAYPAMRKLVSLYRRDSVYR
ncbi:MAG: rod shape-determining protein MreD [Candidatus Methylomirabilales bacterium]